MNDDKWKRPQKIESVNMVFGTVIETYMPKWTDLPEDFRRERGIEVQKWGRIVDDLFFRGATNIRCIVKDPTIDQKDIMRHIAVLLHSFEPSHEHKTAGVAYLLSLWCHDMTYTVLPEKEI